ncbi:CAP domain-containing protein [Deinococcus soli (ex Cha et al. 2016)]|uniref:CAP domain-containing protein n=1 Tax=Deinococcus soli (ex Cha et al. 2016) TaxID=1309411 RepID=UPI0016674293|nr:CAP domain-containing protein [Deinococcus soli (ex Cha et al. 2016)]
MPFKPILALTLLTSLLTACGGANTPGRTDPYTPDPNFTAQRSVQAPDVLDQVEAEAIEHINAARALGIRCTAANGTVTSYPPAGKVTLEGHLQRAAEWHASDMNDRHYMAHVAPSPAPHGAQPADRIMNAGYRPQKGLATGENLASGFEVAKAVVDAWLASTRGHCEALATASYVDVGIAQLNGYWALELANPL